MSWRSLIQSTAMSRAGCGTTTRSSTSSPNGGDGEAVAQDDAAAVAWAELAELQRYDLWSETERVIRLAAARRR